MAALENKIDFAIAFAVNNANPNGDPLNGEYLLVSRPLLLPKKADRAF